MSPVIGTNRCNQSLLFRARAHASSCRGGACSALLPEGGPRSAPTGANHATLAASACIESMDTAIWIFVGLLLAVGFIGSIVPLLPGTTLMLIAVLLQKWLLPDTLTWAMVAWIAVAWF